MSKSTHLHIRTTTDRLYQFQGVSSTFFLEADASKVFRLFAVAIATATDSQQWQNILNVASIKETDFDIKVKYRIEPLVKNQFVSNCKILFPNSDYSDVLRAFMVYAINYPNETKHLLRGVQ